MCFAALSIPPRTPEYTPANRPCLLDPLFLNKLFQSSAAGLPLSPLLVVDILLSLSLCQRSDNTPLLSLPASGVKNKMYFIVFFAKQEVKEHN